MSVLRLWTLIAAAIILTFVAMGVMLGVVGSAASDTVLLTIGTVPCLAVLGWGLIGAPQVPKYAALLILMPVLAAGADFLLLVSDRYPPLSPFVVGATAATAFVIAGAAASWPTILGAFAPGEQQDKIAATSRAMNTVVVFGFVGVLFFQPLAILINAHGDRRPPVMLSGVIAGLRETHGKGATPYVLLSGPAAAYDTTGTRGEFAISWDAYRNMRLGDQQCLTVHTGPLRFHWWRIDDCGRTAQIDVINHAWQAGDHAATIAGLETLVKRDPHGLDTMNAQWLAMVRQALGARGEDRLARRLLALLAGSAYVSTDQGMSSDGWRYDYAALQVITGDRVGAAATFARIENPILLMRATLDPRVRMLMPTGFDARAAADRNIADARDLVRTHPHDLGPLIRLGGALLNLNDGQAIIDVLQPAKPGRDNTDMRATDEDRARWWLLMADAQTDLGRHDQAVAALRASMAPGEANENDPSEPINIASVHLRFGHADQALATLATLNQRPPRWNPANEDRLRQLRACALAQTDHSDQSQPDLTYLRERGNGAAGFLTAALLCTHHDDDVAAIMIHDLENPIKSPNLRLRLSTYAPPPVNFPPDVYRQGLLRVAARPDVRAAMARTGGIGTFDIPPP